ncbi:MAG: FAD-binding oxidoreductase, partial [Alphaproteobacteria bacterium]|nr:FAD-binding oxidoreductase [Alphaproteobacteria bacterium]
NLLKPEQVLADKDDIARQVENVTSYDVDVPLILYPETAEEVRQIVLAANRFQVSLQPYSTGKNWGLGSKLSSRGGLVLVDLHRMNRIIEVNEAFGYAIIEPGVTQHQLFRHLDDVGSDFFCDTTGSGQDTSILGNALDKGVGYNMERFKQLLNLEIVLGDGRIFKTGFGHYEGCKATHTFPEGVGPSYLRMFLQSNFGIVTRATVELRRRPEKNCMFLTYLKSEDHLGDAIGVLKGLKQQGLVNSVTHYYESLRLQDGLAPVLYHELKAQGVEANRDEVTAFLARYSFGAGMIFSNISGTTHQVKAARKGLRALRPYGTTIYVTDRLISLGLFATRLVGWKIMHAYVTSCADFYRMALGEPSDRPLTSLYWPTETELPEGWRNPDHTAIGMHFIIPTVPMSVDLVQEADSIVSEVNAHYDKVEASYAFGLVDENTTHFSISTHFDRSDEGAREESRALAKELNEEFIKAGFHPNRLFADFMDLVVDPDDVFWQVTRDIKKVLDPNGVIAPGHYNIA